MKIEICKTSIPYSMLGKLIQPAAYNMVVCHKKSHYELRQLKQTLEITTSKN